MKTKPRIHQSTLAFRLSATVLCLLASVLWTPAQAQNLVVSNSSVTRSGTHYENNATNAALTISGSLGSFTGTNIILTGTAVSGNVGRIGANLTAQGSLNLTNSTINAALYGIQLAGTSSAILNNTNITTTTTGTFTNVYGINLATSSALTMIGGTITTGTTGARGVSAAGASYVNLQDTVINWFSPLLCG